MFSVNDSPVRAAVVSVGNELLSGQTVDTNAAWLSSALATRGISVVRRYTVGDIESDIDEALGAACAVAELVVVSGGLGPTPDDRTKAAVAERLGLTLVPDDGVRRAVEARYAAGGYATVPKASIGQWMVPAGGRPLSNPLGTAPGLFLENDETVIVLLPGVPNEFKAIVEGDLFAALSEKGLVRGGIHHRIVYTTGIAESALCESLESMRSALAVDPLAGMELAYLPDLLGVDLRFTIFGGTADGAQLRFDSTLAALSEVVGPWRFESESGDLAEAVHRLLLRERRTLAVAESCTGGLVGKRLTDTPGSSETFRGGLICYTNASKVALADIDAEELARAGAVSDLVAAGLAEGAVTALGADVGIGVTGVAGPGGGSPDKPLGTVWFATSVNGNTETVVRNFSGDRGTVRARAAQTALALVYRRLLANEASDGSAS